MSIKNIILFDLFLFCIISPAFSSMCLPEYNSCNHCDTYRCNTGYFGTGQDCISCVNATGNIHATSERGSTLITDCYVAIGAVGNDEIGSWEIMMDTCLYKP